MEIGADSHSNHCFFLCSWVKEMNLRQSEMVAARATAERLREKEQLLTDEIEKFRVGFQHIAQSCCTSASVRRAFLLWRQWLDQCALRIQTMQSGDFVNVKLVYWTHHTRTLVMFPTDLRNAKYAGWEHQSSREDYGAWNGDPKTSYRTTVFLSTDQPSR